MTRRLKPRPVTEVTLSGRFTPRTGLPPPPNRRLYNQREQHRLACAALFKFPQRVCRVVPAQLERHQPCSCVLQPDAACDCFGSRRVGGEKRRRGVGGRWCGGHLQRVVEGVTVLRHPPTSRVAKSKCPQSFKRRRRDVPRPHPHSAAGWLGSTLQEL